MLGDYKRTYINKRENKKHLLLRVLCGERARSLYRSTNNDYQNLTLTAQLEEPCIPIKLN